MRARLPLAVAGVFAVMLAASPAHAFTLENKDAIGKFEAGRLDADKFDLDEQRRQFGRGSAAPGSTPAARLNSQGLMEVPLGSGSLQFGVQAGPSSGFYGPGPMGPAPRDHRQDFNRMVVPDMLR